MVINKRVFPTAASGNLEKCRFKCRSLFIQKIIECCTISINIMNSEGSRIVVEWFRKLTNWSFNQFADIYNFVSKSCQWKSRFRDLEILLEILNCWKVWSKTCCQKYCSKTCYWKVCLIISLASNVFPLLFCCYWISPSPVFTLQLQKSNWGMLLELAHRKLLSLGGGWFEAIQILPSSDSFTKLCHKYIHICTK